MGCQPTPLTPKIEDATFGKGKGKVDKEGERRNDEKRNLLALIVGGVTEERGEQER